MRPTNAHQTQTEDAPRLRRKLMPRGRPFALGNKLNPGGRRPGSKNRVTVEARLAAGAIVDDPAYRARLLARALNGTLPPAIEVMLWAYAKGKPVEEVSVQAEVAYRWLNDDE
jgi:hypothetical protein